MTCRDCKWLRVPLDKAGRRVVRKDKNFLCEAPIPQIMLPVSITRSYDWQWPPSRKFMSGDDGAGCPVFERLER